MDWLTLWTAVGAPSIALAAPFLQWKDRKERNSDREDKIKAGNPYAEFSISSKEYPDDWLQCDLFLYNKWAEPITLEKLTAPEGITLTKAIAQLSAYGGHEPDFEGSGQSLEVKFTAPASTTEGTCVQSPPFVFFMRGSTDFSSRKKVLVVLERTSIMMLIISHSNRRRELSVVNTTTK